MQLGPIKEYLEATPFRPCKIHIADGRTIEVLHPEYAWIHPKGNIVFVAKQDGGFHMIDAESVTVVER